MAEEKQESWTRAARRAPRTHEGDGLVVMLMSPNNRKYPNPLLFVGVSLASYAAFYYLVLHRQATYPASQQARHRDSPLIPPIHPEDLPKQKK